MSADTTRRVYRVIIEVTESYVLDVYATDEETAIAAANAERCNSIHFDRHYTEVSDVRGRVAFTRDDKGEDDADVVAPLVNDLIDEYGL